MSGIALILLAARLVIRLKVYGRLMVDDGLVILAMLCLLVSDTLNTAILSKTYTVQSVQIFHASKPPDYQAIVDSFAKYDWAIAYLFFTSIWAVKGSFLAYYDDLTKRLTTFRRAWWVTIVFTVLTYIGSLFAYAFLDGLQFKNSLKNEAIKYQFAADLSTDVFSGFLPHLCNTQTLKLTVNYQVTIIPLIIALRSQIPQRQKFALVGIFSLTLVVTLFSIIRFTLNSPARGIAGGSWIQVWSCIEQSVSVMVACLASFRVFVIHKRRKSEQNTPRSRVKINSSSSTPRAHLPSVKNGFSDLRSHWGKPAIEARRTGSMELQLLDVASAKSLGPGHTSPKSEGDKIAAEEGA